MRFIILDKAQSHLLNMINQPENKTVIAYDYSDNRDDCDCHCSPRCRQPHCQVLVINGKPISLALGHLKWKMHYSVCESVCVCV